MELMKKLLFISVFTLVNYFTLNAQSMVDTLSLWNCELLNYSGIITIQPNEYAVVMMPFFAKGKNVAIDLLGIPVEIDPERDAGKYQEAIDRHPWTCWAKEMEARVFNTDMMKMIESKADSLGVKKMIYGSIYFDSKGKLLSYSVTIPSEVIDFLTEEQIEQFHHVCLNTTGGGKVPENVLNSVFLRLSTDEFLESMKTLVLEYQKKIKAGGTPYKGHFFNHFLPIEKRPKSNYGELEFRKYLGEGNERDVALHPMLMN